MRTITFLTTLFLINIQIRLELQFSIFYMSKHETIHQNNQLLNIIHITVRILQKFISMYLSRNNTVITIKPQKKKRKKKEITNDSLQNDRHNDSSRPSKRHKETQTTEISIRGRVFIGFEARFEINLAYDKYTETEYSARDTHSLD